MGVLVLGLVTGIAFGYALQRSNASSCACVSSTLQLRDLKVLKIIMTAIGFGSLFVYPLAAAGIAHTSIKATAVLANAIGGIIFGIGFAVAGYCPGTILANLGSRRKEIWLVVAGGLVGTFFYSLVQAPLKPVLLDPLSYGKITLDMVIGVPATVLGPLFGLAMLGGAFYLDRMGKRKVVGTAQIGA